ncbi:DUF2797 domain-containing protein [Acinetobacter baumannii]|uniref:DUF2797 domain-containing protein n=2 Tax=Acinetobacter baumannii TaxID=470 RepID=A0AA90HQ31_ACIBA|nr:DUF2797 domain-containing protein [Acinetobacter baumannii]MEC5497925.1 DUF2797 domain-containing protein [Acinetobacter baumannii]
MKQLISGVCYDQDYNILLMLDSFTVENSRDYLPLKKDTPLTILRMKARYCKGWYDLEKLNYNPCQSKSKLEINQEKCFECAKKSKYNPFFDKIDQNSLSAEQIAYNNQPHIVYLASFGPGIIKVGISNEYRKMDRWMDQGAIYACEIVKTPNAYIARDIEKLISSNKIAPESVNKTKKIYSILQHGCNYDYEKDFLDAIKKIKNIGVKVEESIYQIINNNLVNFDFSYATDMSSTLPIEISGVIIGVIGDYLFLKNNGRILYWKLSLITSHICKIESTVKDIHSNTLF